VVIYFIFHFSTCLKIKIKTDKYKSDSRVCKYRFYITTYQYMYISTMLNRDGYLEHIDSLAWLYNGYN